MTIRFIAFTFTKHRAQYSDWIIINTIIVRFRCGMHSSAPTIRCHIPKKTSAISRGVAGASPTGPSGHDTSSRTMTAGVAFENRKFELHTGRTYPVMPSRNGAQRARQRSLKPALANLPGNQQCRKAGLGHMQPNLLVAASQSACQVRLQPHRRRIPACAAL